MWSLNGLQQTKHVNQRPGILRHAALGVEAREPPQRTSGSWWGTLPQALRGRSRLGPRSCNPKPRVEVGDTQRDLDLSCSAANVAWQAHVCGFFSARNTCADRFRIETRSPCRKRQCCRATSNSFPERPPENHWKTTGPKPPHNQYIIYLRVYVTWFLSYPLSHSSQRGDVQIMAIPRLPLKTLGRNLAQRLSQSIESMGTSWAFMDLFIFPPPPCLENQPSPKKWTSTDWNHHADEF